MTEIYTGSAQLSAQTVLHHPCYVSGVPPSVFFDGYIPSVQSPQELILCSLRYNLWYLGESVFLGPYDVVARVCM